MNPDPKLLLVVLTVLIGMGLRWREERRVAIRAATVRSRAFSSFAAAGTNSIFQAKLGLQRRQRDAG